MCIIYIHSSTDKAKIKNTCVKGNPTLPKFTGEPRIYSGFWRFFFMHFERPNAFWKVKCLSKGEMPFKMHKIIFFS